MIFTFTRMIISSGRPFEVAHIQVELDEQLVRKSGVIKFPNGTTCFMRELNLIQEFDLTLLPTSARFALSLVSDETKESNVSRLRAYARKRLSESIELVKGLRRLV